MPTFESSKLDLELPAEGALCAGAGCVGLLLMSHLWAKRTEDRDIQLVPTIRLIRDLLDLLCTSSDDCIPGSKKVR